MGQFEDEIGCLMPDKPLEPFAVVSGDGMLLMTQMTRGGVVFSGDLALKIAEILCEAHYGSEEVARQQPFSVTDKALIGVWKET
jgi:hypothetical protein